MNRRGWLRRWSEPGPAERLVASGLFDREGYEAQQATSYADDLTAAQDFLDHAGQRATPHPLIDLLALPKAVREPLLGGDIEPLLEHFPDGPPGGDPERRERLLAHHREVGAWRRSRRKRTTRTWDAAAEQHWRAQWLSRALPADSSVSVVMPVRNRPDVVRTAIASLQRQSLPTWELLVVDDGSTDDTLEVLHELAAADPRIRPIAQPWSGVCAARNAGLAAATGRFIAFLDSDNEWDPDFLRLVVTAMAADSLGAAHAVVAKRDAEGRRYLAHQGDLQDLLVANHIDLNGFVVTAEVARATPGFDPALRRWVDHDFAIEVAKRTEIRLLPFIGVDYEDAADAPDRITTTESDGWQFAVLGKHWNARFQPPERDPRVVSVVIVHEGDPRPMLATVEEVRRRDGLDIVVVDNGSRRDFSAHAFASLLDRPDVRYVRLPRTLRDTGARNIGLRLARGARVVLMDGGVRPRPGWLAPLLATLDDPEVALAGPLVLNRDDSISAAGLLLGPEGPVRHLAEHPPEDAARLQDLSFRALPLDCLAARTGTLLADGFDPVFTGDHAAADLGLRLTGRTRLIPAALVNRLAPAPEPVVDKEFSRRWPELPTEEPRFAKVSPRWGLAIAAVGGSRGDRWGDTHFADALGAALTELGQQVGTWRHLSHGRAPRHLDDVSLVIRGLDPATPVAGAVNVLWVISHPDDVDPAEVDGFDLLLAASEPWAADFARRTSRTVHFLPQATDARRVAPRSVPVGDGSQPVFVGGVHEGRTRPLVLAALDAGLPLTVHGPGWRGVIPEANLGREYVPNDELSAVYRSAGLVLNDHWPDMAAHGFLSNRLYDAVAAGARVITDPIGGLEVFGGAVQAGRTADDIAALWQDRSRWPGVEELAAVADRVVVEDSFARRARDLVALVAQQQRRPSDRPG